MKKQIEIQLPNRVEGVSARRNSQENAPIHNKGLNSEEVALLRELEGECKILEWQYLQVNYPKAIFFSILLTLSIFGLLLLKYYRSLRALLLYTRLEDFDEKRSTHVYIKGTDKNEEICEVRDCNLNQHLTRVFEFKHLKYEINEGELIPLGLHYSHKIEYYISQEFLRQGLTKVEAESRQKFYGCNEHRVEVPGYFEFLFDTMTQPFFIFQYFISAVYILESVAIFGILMIFFSWLTTTINYVLLRRSYNQIKETAEKEFPVKVLRTGVLYTIKNVDLVPGDIYEPDEEVPCDSIVVRGELFVDEAGMTGENIPIPKFKLLNSESMQQSCHWIYEGSKIETMKESTLALAVNVGFGSMRGRIIRKILTKVPRQPQLLKKLIYFLLQVLIVIIIIYFATLGQLLSTNIDTSMVIFRFLDFISYAFPAPYPIFFNLAFSFCLVRLHRDDILGTECEKTVESGRMKTLCFDKTGTLTQARMQVSKIYHIRSEEHIQEVTSEPYSNELIAGVFGCCNSVEMIHRQPKGDEIDLRMFLHSDSKIEPCQDADVIRRVVQQQQKWQILKIHQYESKFQSMSVLVRQTQSKQYYIFAKGSPEMIHNRSRLKYSRFEEFIKRLSLQGYRSIAFGCREVLPSELTEAMKLDRDGFLQHTSILGVVTFVNLLKEDACESIATLTNCDIATKIITGDNIFLGIQTAVLVGMIPSTASIAVLEGKKYDAQTGQMEVLTLSRDSDGQYVQKRQKVADFAFDSQADLFYAVDNDFVRARSHSFLNGKIKVFARISPENKALIIRMHKEQYEAERKNRSFWEKMFGECGYKVGMVGDGANDLIAIKDADVGIGITSTDAVYSASFAVRTLSQIDEIIREAKNIERQLVDIVQYFGVCSAISVVQTLVLTEDASYPASMQLIYRNFGLYLLITLFIGVSRPAQKLTKYFAATNFLGLEHHLVYWINSALLTAGLVISYQYYSHSSDFSPNPKPIVSFSDGINGVCKSATVVFLCSNVIYLTLGLFIYRSSPWKESFYQNKAFTITILINSVLVVLMFFLTEYLSFLDVVQIGKKEAGICLAIMTATMLACWLFNYLVESKQHNQLKDGFMPQSSIQIIQSQKTSN